MSTLTTVEAARLIGIHPHSFARWAREHGLAPLARRRVGRSYITVWSRAALAAASAPVEARILAA